MILDTGSQLLVLVVSLVGGVLAGMLQLGNVAVARLSKDNRIVKFVCDFVYVIAVFGGLFLVCNVMNYGVVRWYIVLGYAVGMWVVFKWSRRSSAVSL